MLKLGLSLGLSKSAGGAAANPIIARTNTTVTGTGPYTVTKTGGVDGTFDADAVTATGFPGDFRLAIIHPATALTAVIGMNADPATDANYTSIDRALSFGGDSNARTFESGVQTGTFGIYSSTSTYYIRRVGSVIDALVSSTGNFSDATTFATFTNLSGTLYFDCSLSVLNSSFTAQLT